ncbi:MAG TPA: hypothetical protein VEF04_02735, partial [Blastocatellia bacterium]|nr:hypothetical protein [Blastocatellia bacterium]
PGEEITQQDANTIEETSAPQIESTDSQSVETSAQQSEVSQEQSEKQVPFHEHPRFKELIDYRRQSEERLAAYEQQIQEMQRMYQEALKARQPQPEINPFVAKLKEIDPRYGEWAESVEARASKAEAVEQELQQLRTERLINQYESAVERLHSEHKTPDTMKARIKRELDAAVIRGEVKLQDVPRAYKQAFDDYTKWLDEVKRSERASYVQDKSKDATAPSSQPKGKLPPRNEKGQFTGDRESDLAMIAKRALKLSKAEGEL